MTPGVLAQNLSDPDFAIGILKALKKQHKDVLKNLESVGCSEKFNRLNFELIY